MRLAADTRRRWLGSLAITLALVGALILLADAEAFARLAAGLSWPGLLAGLLLLQAEGLATALRLRQLAPAATGLRPCLAVTARWVVALALLPARLGEIYGLHLMSSRLDQPFGRSLNNLFVQRLFDVIVLALLGVMAMLAAGGRLAQPQLFAALLVVAVVLALVVWRLPWCFALVARLGVRGRRRRVGRALLRASLHARRAARDTLRGRQPLALALSSTAKWICNIGGIVTLMLAVVPTLPIGGAAALAIIGNLAAVIPLSGIGGVGVGDLTLAGGLAWYGLAPGGVAAATLSVRALLLAAPLLFALLVRLSEALWPEAGGRAPGRMADAR